MIPKILAALVVATAPVMMAVTAYAVYTGCRCAQQHSLHTYYNRFVRFSLDFFLLCGII